MKSPVHDLIAEVIDKEGGYSNDPNDSGGETNFGITVSVARVNGYLADMSKMPRSVAEQIYEKKYWTDPCFHKVHNVYINVAREMFDTGVNCGTGKAIEFLQMALNALNRQGKDYPDIDEDCEIGPITMAALTKYRKKRGADGEVVLLKALNCLQGARYIELSRNRQTDENFVYGWLANRIELP